MKTNEMINLLASFEKRLAAISDQAAEARAHAQHTIDRINKLRQDIEQLKHRVIATADTSDHAPLQDTSAHDEANSPRRKTT